MTTRIDTCFINLRAQKRAALVAFVMAGDPDPETSLAIIKGLPGAGVDIIEIGMPFSDPMADGPAIQAAGLRALKAGMTLKKTLALAREVRATNPNTPLILMGYYNPIYVYGVPRFIEDAKAAGVDGFIVVDLPPEEDDEFCIPVREAGLSFIRLATPTTDEARLPKVLAHTSGFVYSVSIAGITGAGSAAQDQIARQVTRIRSQTDLPVVVGFGIKTAQQVQETAPHADGVVVGSAIVNQIAHSLTHDGRATSQTVGTTLEFVRELAKGV